MDLTIAIYTLFIIILVIFLGFELISKVPSTLHTPLMSGSNAISGITLLGAIVLLGMSDTLLSQGVAFFAIVTATINVVGGYLVTDRMLDMFKSKDKKN
jgi:NAD(P) transhydrogenase subunit alpha